jgi:hypothetical protein
MPFTTFSLFATLMAAGVSWMLPLVPLGQFGRRFFVLGSLIAILLVVLAAVERGLDLSYFHFAAAGFLVVYNVTLPRQSGLDPMPRAPAVRAAETRAQQCWLGGRVALGLLLAAGLSGLVGAIEDGRTLAASLPARSPPLATPAHLVVVSLVSSAALLGAALVAMVLGHWYLVAGVQSFAPLRKLTLTLAGALVARCALAGAGVVAQREGWEAMLAAGTVRFLLSEGVLHLARVVFGFVAPLVLVRMVWGCVRLESNQSATGILYVVVVFVLLGEILALRLLLSSALLL